MDVINQEDLSYSDSVCDNLLWCEDCGHGVPGACEEHGSFFAVKDHTVPSHARLTAPSLVTIKPVLSTEVETTDSDVGVFAKRLIRSRTMFGPYEGALRNNCNVEGMGRLQFQIFGVSGSRFIDCNDESTGNWMMFVRQATSHVEQNLVAFQYHGQIFFAVTRPISRNMELKVWFSADYGRLLGKQPLSGGGYVQHQESASDEVLGKTVLEQVTREPTPAKEVDSAHLLHDNQLDVGRDFYDDFVFSSESVRNPRALLEIGGPRHASSTTRTDFQSSQTFSSWSPKRRTRKRKNRISLKCKQLEDACQVEESMNGKKRKKPVASRDVINLADEGVSGKLPSERFDARRQSCLGRVIICHVCAMTLTSNAKLKVHLLRHTGERPFRCDSPGCDKAFDTHFKLIRHQRIHSSERPYLCPYCEKSFLRKDHLTSHVRVHSHSRTRQECLYCGKGYSSSYALRMHLAIHAAERGELTCGVCAKEFSDFSELDRHLKAHLGSRSVKESSEKVHPCPTCGKSFFAKKDIRRHLVVHTRNRDFLCQYCPCQFGRRDHLVRHMRLAHREGGRHTGLQKGKSLDLSSLQQPVV